MRVRPLLTFTLALVSLVLAAALFATASAQGPVDGTWSIFAPPAPRQGHSWVYDSARHRMILYGGSTLLEVWALDLAGEPRWTQVPVRAGASPGIRAGHAAIYDPVGDRMILFGGTVSGGNFPANDVWSLSLSGTPAWTLLSPAGTPPAGRRYHAAFYDAARNRMVTFGGDAPFDPLSDTWALSLDATPTWTQLAGPDPAAPRGKIAVAELDAARDRLLYVNTSGYAESQTWEFPLAGPAIWSPVAVPILPPIRRDASSVWDAAGDRLLMYGGEYGGIDGETWALEFGGSPEWRLLPTTGLAAPERAAHRAAYDPIGRRMVVFGGTGGASNTRYNDVWSLSLSEPASWARLLPSDTLPPYPRSSHAVMRDELHHRDLLFGGFTGNISCCDDAWAYTSEGAGVWAEIPVVGERPVPRYLHSAIYDPVRDRIIVYGGRAGPALGEIWALSLSGTPAWTRIVAPGEPNPRYGHSAIYDPLRDRMIVFGGVSGLFSFGDVNEVWALSLGGTPAWSEITPAGPAPFPREEHTAIYDPDGDRMIVFGGQNGIVLNDVWALSLGGTPAWTELHPGGLIPTARMLHVAVHDPRRGRMIVQGGLATNNTALSDVRALDLVGAGGWTRLRPEGFAPSARFDHAATFDVSHDRMNLFFGETGFVTGEVWSLDFGDVSTAILAALVRAEAETGRVRLLWSLSETASSRVTVYRRMESGAWEARGAATPEGADRVSFEDRDVVPDARCGYRLGFGSATAERFSAETWVRVPRASLALESPRPNPARGSAIPVRFTLASAEPATLELLDVSGRRIDRAEVGALGAGTHAWTFGRRPLAAGVYLLRLTQRGVSVSGRVALLR